LKLYVLTRPDEIDGRSIAECPEMPACLNQGETEEEAIAGIREAIEPYLE